MITGGGLRGWARMLLASYAGILLFFVDYYGGERVPFLGGKSINVLGLQVPLVIFTGVTALAVMEILTRIDNKYIADTASRKRQLHNFCISLFEKYFSEWEKQDGAENDFRITIFEVKRRWFSGAKYLRFSTRYQTGEASSPGVKEFELGEGAAGMAHESRAATYKPSLPIYDDDTTGYINQMDETYGLPQSKTEKLTRKASSYFCVPMLAIKRGSKPRAILCIDALKPDTFYENESFEKDKLPDILNSVESFSSGFFF